MTNIYTKLDKIFEFEDKLNLLLDEERYEQFNQHQELLGDLLRDLLKKHSTNELNNIVEELKLLQKRVNSLHLRAVTQTQQLRDKSLLLQRNKSKIQAYK